MNEKSIKEAIIKHVKKEQPVYMGQIIMQFNLSFSKGRKIIDELIKQGALKYSTEDNRIIHVA